MECEKYIENFFSHIIVITELLVVRPTTNRPVSSMVECLAPDQMIPVRFRYRPWLLSLSGRADVCKAFGIGSSPMGASCD